METSKIGAKIKGLWKKSNDAFCDVFLCKTNLKRDIIIISIAIILSAAIIIGDRYYYLQRKPSGGVLGQSSGLVSEEQVYEEVKNVQAEISTQKWKNYQSQWYGFAVKYPETWAVPVTQAATRGTNWEYRFQFRKAKAEEDNPYIGFDVIIYNLAKTKEIANIDEFPKVKNENLKNSGGCPNIEGHIIETGDYPAEEIYIPPTDDCYNPALFFDFVRGDYIYVLTPRIKAGVELSNDPRVEIMDNFPDLYAAVSTLKIIDIVRPKPAPAPEKPRITAPHPVSFRVVGGRLVCAKKNDHPSKSKQNKGRHLDMECCLDPDEYPNPWCYYDPAKYGKYL